MNENDNINFDDMQSMDLNWGGGKYVSQQQEPEEEEYDSLYDELLEKCNPSKFPIGEFGNEKFQIANSIYTLLKETPDRTDETLVDLRNRAIDKLGVHISTKKKYGLLEAFLDPDQYISRKPYNGALVASAGDLFEKLLKNKNDIRGLERLELEADGFRKEADEYDYQTLDSKQYIKKHPDGIHSEYVFAQIEYNFFMNNTAHNYLQRYPEGMFKDEATDYLNLTSYGYLKKYPNGRYAKDARSNYNSSIIALILFCVIFVIIIITILFNK